MSLLMDVEFATPTKTTLYLLDNSAPTKLLQEVLPSWTRQLGAKSVNIASLSVSNNTHSLHEAIEFIRTEHHACGALAPATRSFAGLPDIVFDRFCPNATALGIFDVITKTGGLLKCRFSMPAAVGAALDDILGSTGKPFAPPPRSVLVLGASALGDALILNLTQRHTDDQPAINDVTVADTDVKALNHSASGLQGHAKRNLVSMRHIAHPADLTRLMASLPEGALIVHAGNTDSRLVPLIHPAGLVFPRQSIVWDQTAYGSSLLLREAALEPADNELTLADSQRFQLFLLAAEIAEILGDEPSSEDLSAMVNVAERPVKKRRVAS